MWTQIVGKTRLAHAPLLNHGWQVPLYLSARGLTTSVIPYQDGLFQIDLDVVDHELLLTRSTGATARMPLEPMTVADFHRRYFALLDDIGVRTSISRGPNEVEPAVPFAEDTEHASYDADAVHTFWLQLVQAHRLLGQFRSRFVGKASPVHFFWGAMDLATARFSGRPAPAPAGVPNCGDWVMVEGYSAELISVRFWPGGGRRAASTPMPTPRPTASPRPLTSRTARGSTKSSESSYCPTRRLWRPPTRTRSRCASWRAPTTRPPSCSRATARPSKTIQIGGTTEVPAENGRWGCPLR